MHTLRHEGRVGLVIGARVWARDLLGCFVR